MVSFAMKKYLKPILLICLIPLIAGCSMATKAEDNTVLIPDIPFFSQEAYQCGPTALAIVLDYWYKRTGSRNFLTPDQIAADIYSASARGVLGIDLQLYAQKRGFLVHQYSSSLTDLKKNVDQGIPTIVFVNYGFSVYEVNHFMVVKGYAQKVVIVNSGKHENQAISEKEMEKIWKRNRYWALAIEPSL
jgi:predicted double-glycine peptidase